MGKYVMYFCTTSSYIKSNLCFATADGPKGPYTYQDTILYSGFTSQTTKQTDFYDVMGEDVKITDYVKHGGFNNIDWPNCIDPAVFYDADGKMWMVYGSWSGGIFLLELDEETGYPIHPETDEADSRHLPISTERCMWSTISVLMMARRGINRVYTSFL